MSSFRMSRRVLQLIPVVTLALLAVVPAKAQQSVARQWNEALLQSIREDFARPTVHARNLFHTSVAMWDAWAAYDTSSEPYLLGNRLGDFTCGFEGIPAPANTESARREAISYAAYRILLHRFRFSPAAVAASFRFQGLMNELGYDTSVTSIDYQGGNPASLGNYIASCIIEFGAQDGANESGQYGNQFYLPVNPPLVPAMTGNPLLQDLNRWQPLSFEVFVDQAGNPVPLGTPEFLGAEWGDVQPFSLSPDDLRVRERDGHPYKVYQDPDEPPHLELETGAGRSDEYRWNFLLVALWSSHLDPADQVQIDISPAAIGNLDLKAYSNDFETLQSFYDLESGGDTSLGHLLNPATGQPYWAQIVSRGDYARVLAEFWADGPDSETPPGHWFTILNYVNDHPDFVRRYRGFGPVLSPLEWDVKAYLALGGAMHDAAVAAWSIKGWYDYIRPISAIRGMAELGQSSSPDLPRYHVGGLPLVPGFVELVSEGDPLLSHPDGKVNDLKIKAWRGPEYVYDPVNDAGGVGWVLASHWWPYQRPTFVTPPFAGYISGHSTFSRAAAEVLTELTGDPFFPGGMGEFVARKDEFLVFEEGPSEDIVLQWATYRDASDQCSLSRIWGGIHPPADDIPGRLIGEKIGKDAFAFADRFFSGQATSVQSPETPSEIVLLEAFPNPVRPGDSFTVDTETGGHLAVVDMQGRMVFQRDVGAGRTVLEGAEWAAGVYVLQLQSGNTISHRSIVVMR